MSDGIRDRDAIEGGQAPGEALDALRRSEARYRQLIETLPHGVQENDCSGVITYSNRAHHRILGYDDGELVGHAIWEVQPPGQPQEDLRRFLAYLVREQPAPATYQTVSSRKDGTPVDLQIDWDYRRGEGGALLGFISVITDVSGRRRAERALQESEERLRFLSENLAEGMVYQIDSGADGRERRFTYLSPAVERLHGLGVGAVLREPSLLYDQVLGEHRAALAERESRAFADMTTLNADVQVELPSGERRWRRFISAPRVNPDGRVVWNGIELDITRQKQMEQTVEQAQKMESVGRLAGGVAHDFNNMLGVILGHAELALLQVGAADPLRADLEEICNAANRSADLTRQLLAFARRQAVAPKTLDLNDVVAGMLKLMRRLIGEEIDLAWMPGAGLWPVRMDPSQIDQVLANLCVNARDAIGGIGAITIRTENRALDAAFCQAHDGCSPGDYVLLAVSDDGRGMEPEVLDHIFEPFFTTKSVGQGTGLGLATVYGIVRQCDGFITVDSEPSAGTTFSIYLPRFAGAAVESGEPPLAESPRARGETVLLVEDEPAILRVGHALLEGLGYVVLPARTPEEALRAAAGHSGEIHLLLTDVVMPGMNGRELARRLVERKPGLACLFMSGHSADVVTDRGVLEADLQFVQKPFTLHSLAVAVRRALDRT